LEVGFFEGILKAAFTDQNSITPKPVQQCIRILLSPSHIKSQSEKVACAFCMQMESVLHQNAIHFDYSRTVSTRATGEKIMQAARATRTQIIMRV
jgi:hypothetical protein